MYSTKMFTIVQKNNHLFILICHENLLFIFDKGNRILTDGLICRN